jgi:DNA-binding transcriptional LysR family regulator
METLANLESFARSAELGSFSAAARRLGLTPAAISRNVAQLEGNLGVRLFQRSTRSLALTEAGERFRAAIEDGLDRIHSAIADVATQGGQPAGTLKVSMSTGFGIDWLLPLLPDFLARYPGVVPDWHFDNRQVDLIGEGYDAAIGGGIELATGIAARELAPIHVVAVASPAYAAQRRMPKTPADLAALDGIGMRSAITGRVRQWKLRDRRGQEMLAEPKTRVMLGDPEAMTRAALMDLGVALVALPHALPHLERGTLTRLLPDWHADAGAISLYFSSKRLLPAKTRAFIDYVVERFREQQLARRFAAL